MSQKRREEIEELAGTVKNGQTNWFQLPKTELSPPANVMLEIKDDTQITWDTAYAAEAPLSHYEVFREGKKVATVKHQPQVSKDPFQFRDDRKGNNYQIVSVDMAGNRAESETLSV